VGSKTMAKWLGKAGIPPEAIAKILAYAQTQAALKKEVKSQRGIWFNDKAKLDTTQIDDKRNVNQRFDAKSATKGYK